MAKMDRKTKKAYERIERRITENYFQAWHDMSMKLDHYVNGWDEKKNGKIIHHKGMFERRDDEIAAFYAGAYGDPRTHEAKVAFARWWASQEGRRDYWIESRDEMAKRLTDTNVITSAYVNGELPKMYAEEGLSVMNLATKAAIDQGILGTNFNMFDEYTLRNLFTKKKDVFRMNVNIPEDERWNRDKLQNALIQSIIHGENYKRLADRFQSVANMNRSAAIRNARTAMSAARGVGQQDRYDDLAKQGCISTKIWSDVHDSIPPERPEHWEASGQEVPYNEPFIVGGEELMYPGDPAGSGWNIYNCRCRQKTGSFKFISVLKK